MGKKTSEKRRLPTKETVMASTAKRPRRSDRLEADGSAHRAAPRSGAHEEAAAHMPRLRRRWTKEAIMASAANHSCVGDWIEVDEKAHAAARRLGIEDEATAHMSRAPTVRKFRRSDEDVLASARKHSHPYEWFKADRGAYRCAKRRGLFEKAVAHMTPDVRGPKNGGGGRPSVALSMEHLRAEAAKYRHRSDFAEGSVREYEYARKRGLLGEICAHMTRKPVSGRPRKRSDEDILASARGHGRYALWFKVDRGACAAAKRRGLLDEATAHMIPDAGKAKNRGGGRPRVALSMEHLRAEAAKYRHRSDFAEGSVREYAYARKRGLLKEICAHMTRKPGSGRPPEKVGRGRGKTNGAECAERLDDAVALSDETGRSVADGKTTSKRRAAPPRAGKKGNRRPRKTGRSLAGQAVVRPSVRRTSRSVRLGKSKSGG